MTLLSYRRQQILKFCQSLNFVQLSLDQMTYRGDSFFTCPTCSGNEFLFEGYIDIFTGSKYLKQKIYLYIDDINFLSLPHIYLCDQIIPQLRLPLPHISVDSNLKIQNKYLHKICYAFEDSSTLPRYNIASILAFSLSQTKITLEKLCNKQTLQQELANEVEPMWIGTSIMNKGEFNNLKTAQFPTSSNPQMAFTTIILDSESKYKEIICNGNSVYIPDTATVPPFSMFLNPNFTLISINKFFNWLKQWHLNTYLFFFQELKKFNDFKKSFFFCIHYKTSIIYFYINLTEDEIRRIRGCNDLTKFKFNNNIKLNFSTAIPISFKELITRNIKNLGKNNETVDICNLKILQVGAGSIGGYLANSLVKIGAGVGINSKFTIVDPDILKVENIGRHALGALYLHQGKAKALCTSILNDYSIYLTNERLNIESQPKYIEQISPSYFEEFDLIIDATGKFEVAQYLNETIRKLSPTQQKPILHLWIFANGECVQALWNDNNLSEEFNGCHYCMEIAWQVKKDRYYPLPNFNPQQTTKVNLPCSTYTPYSLSSSLNITSIAIDLILNWRSKALKFNYVTRYSTLFDNFRPDTKIEKNEHCIICNN